MVTYGTPTDPRPSLLLVLSTPPNSISFRIHFTAGGLCESTLHSMLVSECLSQLNHENSQLSSECSSKLHSLYSSHRCSKSCRDRKSVV